MNKEVGLWIDHRKAVIVTLTLDGEETSEIESGVEEHVRYASGSNAEGSRSPEDVRDRGFGNHLARFYDEVIARVRDADAIQIFGPGEAKGELAKRMESQGLGARLVRIETVDKMSDRQIAAKVRLRFPQ